MPGSVFKAPGTCKKQVHKQVVQVGKNDSSQCYGCVNNFLAQGASVKAVLQYADTAQHCARKPAASLYMLIIFSIFKIISGKKMYVIYSRIGLLDIAPGIG